MSNVLAKYGLGSFEKIGNTAKGQWQKFFTAAGLEGIGKDIINGAYTPSISREVLHSLLPDNYELYKMVVQVVDPSASAVAKKSTLIEEFDFTIMPESVEVVRQFKTTVMPTLTSNFTLDSFTESPSQFVLVGTFGVNHKVKFNLADFTGKFDPVILTGYGLVKRLEKIIQKTKGTSSDGTPYQTYLINKAFNSTIRVEINKAVFRQNVSRNGLWVYELTFTKVSDNIPYWMEQTKMQSAINDITDKVIGDLSSKILEPMSNRTFALITSVL